MKFVETIKKRKFTLISIFLFLYFVFNFLDGQRGLISYYEKQNIIKELLKEKTYITSQLTEFEKKNNLLTNIIDKDYLEIIYRKKFMVGKKNEKIYLK